MPDVICGDCSLWNSGTERCRVTNSPRVITDACNLTPGQRLTLLKQSRVLAAYQTTAHVVYIVSVDSLCAGGHIRITYTVDGGPERNFVTHVDELREDGDTTALEQALSTMADICRGCGVTTFAAAQAVLEGTTLYVGRAD